MSLSRASCVALTLCGVAACGAPAARHTPARPHNSLAIAPPAAASAASVDGQPQAGGHLSVTFLGEDAGSAWGPWGEATIDAAAVVLPCYTRALSEKPTLAGWIRVRVPARNQGGYRASSFLDSSALPRPLVDCVVAALRTLEAPEGLEGPARVAYVTLY